MQLKKTIKNICIALYAILRYGSICTTIFIAVFTLAVYLSNKGEYNIARILCVSTMIMGFTEIINQFHKVFREGDQ